MQKSLKTCLLDKFNLSPNGLNSYFTPNSISVRARSSPTLVTYLSCMNRSISVQSGYLILLNAKMVQSEIPKTYIWSCHFTLYKSSRPPIVIKVKLKIGLANKAIFTFRVLQILSADISLIPASVFSFLCSLLESIYLSGRPDGLFII